MELKELLEHFNNIVKEVPNKYPAQYSNYSNKQDLKNKLTTWKQENQQLILEIYDMLYEDDCYLHDQMFTNEEWNTIYQKFTNAIVLSNCSSGYEEILKRESWKTLDHEQIVEEVDKRTQAMYELCCDLRQQQRRSFYSGSNRQGINNSYSKTASAYESQYR